MKLIGAYTISQVQDQRVRAVIFNLIKNDLVTIDMCRPNIHSYLGGSTVSESDFMAIFSTSTIKGLKLLHSANPHLFAQILTN